jgi:hypothetical protein
MNSKRSPSSVMGWLAKSFNIGTRGPRPSQGTGQVDSRASPAPLLQFETSHISDHESSYEGTPSDASMVGDMGIDQQTWVNGGHSAPEQPRGSPPWPIHTICPSPEETVKGHNDPLQDEKEGLWCPAAVN